MSEKIKVLLLMSIPILTYYIVYFIYYFTCKFRSYYYLKYYSSIYKMIGCYETLDFGYRAAIGTRVELMKNQGNIEVLNNNRRIAALRCDKSSSFIDFNRQDKIIGVITRRKKGHSSSYYHKGIRSRTLIQYYIYNITVFQSEKYIKIDTQSRDLKLQPLASDNEQKGCKNGEALEPAQKNKDINTDKTTEMNQNEIRDYLDEKLKNYYKKRDSLKDNNE